MRIGENARKCVVFFGVPSERADIDYGGTGFLVGYNDGGVSFGYLVTAAHVARELEKRRDTGFFIRVNSKGGGSELIAVESIDWAFHWDGTVDIAVAALTFSDEHFDQIHLDLESLISDHRDASKVMCGDAINVIGLFRLHAGSGRNIPLVHSGNVAILPDPHERVPMRDRVTGEIMDCEVYLVEAHTLEGLSGSPVFIHEAINLPFKAPGEEGIRAKAYGAVKLIGVYTGSWDGEPGEILAADRNIRGGLRVPVGMGLVVPAYRLLELLQRGGGLVEMRRREIERRKSEQDMQ